MCINDGPAEVDDSDDEFQKLETPAGTPGPVLSSKGTRMSFRTGTTSTRSLPVARRHFDRRLVPGTRRGAPTCSIHFSSEDNIKGKPFIKHRHRFT